MKLKKLSAVVLSLSFILLLSVESFACACCAEPGTYRIWTGKPDAFHTDLMKEFSFDKSAYLYMTEAGFDSIKGLSLIENEYEDGSWTASPGGVDLVSNFTGKTWTFTLKTKSGKTGVLTLPLPAQMVTFKADIHDDEKSSGNGPLLYKEFRFKGNVTTGTGFLKGSIVRPTTYFLVFQGRGNGCDNAEDFTNWRLEIEGSKAKYSFFGKLASGQPRIESK